jgi:SAM-dependent methyltransferase
MNNPKGITEFAEPQMPPPSILDILRCPRCCGTLVSIEKDLTCTACERSFPFVKGVFRFVESEKYAGSFGFQWHQYTHTQLDTANNHDSELAFQRRTGFSPEELRGKLVLDVGCGMGRFAEVASRWGARVVGVDLSVASEVAARNLADRPQVNIFQADVFSLPFAPESFDYIYSIGVLHHTTSCEKAFKSLVPLLKPGGRISIWLYSGYNKWYRFSDLYRKVTPHFPNRLLHALCQVAVPLYYIHLGLRRVPLVGRYMSGVLNYFLPVSLLPDRHARVLDTFDWYSPQYQSKHTYEEVFRWFESCGLGDLRVMHESIAVQGRKPTAALAIQTEEALCAESQAL